MNWFRQQRNTCEKSQPLIQSGWWNLLQLSSDSQIQQSWVNLRRISVSSRFTTNMKSQMHGEFHEFAGEGISMTIKYKVKTLCKSGIVPFYYFILFGKNKNDSRYSVAQVLLLDVFCDETLCSLVDVYQHFRETWCLFKTEDNGRFLQNLGSQLPHNTALHSTIQYS